MDLMSLLAKLTLDKTEYDTGLKEAEDDAKGLTIPQPVIPKPKTEEFTEGVGAAAEESGSIFKEVITGVWQGLKDSILQIGVTGLITSVIGAMKQGISLALDGGKKIADNSKNLQISTKAYQEYEYVLGKSGLKAKDLSTAMDGLGKIMSGDLNEKQKKYVQELEEMGFSIDEAASKEQNLANVMKALADYQGADKGQIIDWLFGKNQNWTGYFDQTSDEIANLKKEAADMGLIMSDESIENAVKFNEATEKISTQIEALKRSFGEWVLPLLTSAVEKVGAIVSFFTGDHRSLSQIFEDSDKEYANELLTIEETSSAAQLLADKLFAMGETSQMTAEQYEVWKGTAEELIKLVPSLGEVIDIETGQIDGNTESIKNNIKEWENLAKKTALQTLKEEKYAELVKRNEDAIAKQIELNTKSAEVETKKAKAIKLANEYLQDEYEGAYRRQIWGIDEVTEENFDKAKKVFGALEGEAGDAMRAYGQAENEVNSLTSSLESTIEELEKGKQDYHDWVVAADELFGSASESSEEATNDVEELNEAIEALPDGKTIHINVESDMSGLDAHEHAKGAWNIPYDNYPALLHRNEMVLTASQARKYRDDQGGEVSYDTIAEVVAVAVSDAIGRVNVLMSGDKVGDLTTKRVKNNINSSSYSRLRAFGG